jgi:Methyltransferase domain
MMTAKVISQNILRVNLGGEGEVPGVLNQQGPWALLPSWRSADGTKTLANLRAAGHRFVISSNLHLPFTDKSMDVVYTRDVPIDIMSLHGPGVQRSEIKRILKPGGIWIKNNVLEFVKP